MLRTTERDLETGRRSEDRQQVDQFRELLARQQEAVFEAEEKLKTEKWNKYYFGKLKTALGNQTTVSPTSSSTSKTSKTPKSPTTSSPTWEDPRCENSTERIETEGLRETDRLKATFGSSDPGLCVLDT
ncbi:hypothetical protein BGZ97_010893, partial [Linnemannia gamsii]